MAQNRPPGNLMQNMEKVSVIFTRVSTYRNPKLFLIVQYNFQFLKDPLNLSIFIGSSFERDTKVCT